MTRNGKIARLPGDIREELNRRLEQNIPGITLVRWLNSLPEVQEILTTLFDGVGISPQNLSEWRQGGFAEWQTRREFLDEIRESTPGADELEEAAPFMADHASRLLSARIALMLSKWNGDPDDPVFARIKHLSALARTLVAVRRSDHNSARLKMDLYEFKRRRWHNRESDERLLHWVREQAAAIDRAKKQRAAEKPSSEKPAAAAPPAPPAASVPPAAETQSNPIKPLFPHHQAPDPVNAKPELVPLTALSSSSPPPSPPSPDSDSQNSDTNSPVLVPASAPAANATLSPPVSESDLWQTRHRPLPSDPDPSWRIQLPITNVIPPWQTPVPHEETPRKSILARAGH